MSLVDRLIPLMYEFSDTLADSGLTAHPIVVLSERDWVILEAYCRAKFPDQRAGNKEHHTILSLAGVYFVKGNDA